MAVVLCDGAPASIKALSWAAVPGHFLPQHDGTQLILVHVWNRSLSLPRATPAELLDRAPQFLDDPATLCRLPPGIVLRKTLESISESKVTRDTLNYKLETLSVSDSARAASPPAGAQPARSAGRREREKEREEPVDDAAAAAAEALVLHANATAQYAHERAVHHGADCLLLGPGNRAEGKGVAMGHVAHAVLRTQREAHPLCFVKPNGTTLRPNTAALRHVVLLVPPRPRDGGERSDPPEEEEEEEEEEALQLEARVLRRALRRCRDGTEDAVGAVVLAESGTAEAAVRRRVRQARAIIEHGAAERRRTTAPLSQPAESSAGPTESAEANPPAAEQTEETREEQWPTASVCQLRATKQVPTPTFENAAAQVVKFLQQRKCDVIIVPSRAPEELLLALITMTKQHVLILPTNVA